MIGYVKIFRELCNHPIWVQEKFTRGQAWVDLILLAQHKEGYVRKRGIRIDLKPGQLAWSLKSLADKWRWSIGKVKRFLIELQTDGQIELQNTNVSTTITLLNYDKWQLKNGGENDITTVQNEIPKRSQNTSQTDSKQTPYKNGKNDKNGEVDLEYYRQKFNFGDLENRFVTIDVVKSFRKFTQYRQDKNYKISLAAFTNWLDSDVEKGYNRRENSDKEVKLYCPNGHETKSVLNSKRHIGYFCKTCGEQLVGKHEIP